MLSFANTTTEFVEGRKTCTRRVWKQSHLEMWQRQWDRGNLTHDAWDRQPIRGGQKIGKFNLTCRPYLERLSDMPEEDVAAEGGFCETVDQFIQLIGKAPEDVVAVIRFEKVSNHPHVAAGR